MKKLFLISFVFCLMSLSSCALSSDKEMENKFLYYETRISDLEQKIERLENKENSVLEQDNVESTVFTGENYLKVLDPVNEITIFEEPIEFNGMVSPNAEKIVVTAKSYSSENGISKEQNDIYTLKNFKKGDSSFRYKASQEFNNLSFGSNHYEITAFYDDGTTITKNLNIYLIFNNIE